MHNAAVQRRRRHALIQRALLTQAKERSDAKFSLSATYLEIYNEAVFDLLTSRHTGSSGSLASLLRKPAGWQARGLGGAMGRGRGGSYALEAR